MRDGGVVSVEEGFPAATVAQLKAMGHRFSAETGEYGGYQAIVYDRARKVYRGATESRKDGIALGY
jgi:gamma-glutamyltranspeptidase/glutathione hydrolase